MERFRKQLTQEQDKPSSNTTQKRKFFSFLENSPEFLEGEKMSSSAVGKQRETNPFQEKKSSPQYAPRRFEDFYRKSTENTWKVYKIQEEREPITEKEEKLRKIIEERNKEEEELKLKMKIEEENKKQKEIERAKLKNVQMTFGDKGEPILVKNSLRVSSKMLLDEIPAQISQFLLQPQGTSYVKTCFFCFKAIEAR